MAGHSKWANIRFRKAQQDAKKGVCFTKVIREITVAARLGGENAETNPRLRLAIQKAMSYNLSKENVQRAIKRATQPGQEGELESIIYEGYGPGHSAWMVETLSNNRNRTAAEVRSTFTKAGGQMTASGAVAYLFRHQGFLEFSGVLSEDIALELLEMEGVEEILESPEGEASGWQLYTLPQAFASVIDACRKLELGQPEHAALEWFPLKRLDLTAESFEKFEILLSKLENLEDVQNVYHNVNPS